MRVLKYILICLACIGVRDAFCQDVSFSQMYANPMYLSPSFTGLTNGSRVSLAYRDQWPGIPNTYRTYAFAADHFFETQKSGVGIMALRDDSGQGKLVRQNFSLLYAYEFEVFRGYYMRPGIQIKYSEQNLNLSSVIYPSNQDVFGFPIPDATISDPNENYRFVDAAASAMVYSDFFWFGTAVDHLIKSDIGVTDIETSIPVKTTIYGGYKYTYKKGRKRKGSEQSITLAFDYRLQQDFNQLDVGSYWFINPMEIGIWYRGLPFASERGLKNNDGLIFIAGVNVGPVRFAYSYDLTISELAGLSNGANELTLIYRFNQNLRKKSYRGAMPCSSGNYSGSSGGSKYNRGRRKIF